MDNKLWKHMQETIKNNNFFEKIEKRAKKDLSVNEVYLNTDLSEKTILYLKKQKYLEFSKIEKILKNNFMSKYPFGYVLKNQHGYIVGFMGTIFSSKGDNLIYCNIHTWIVDEKYRINSFLLLTPLIEKKIVLTAFTPVNTLVGLLEKFGFKKILMNYRITFLFSLFSFFKSDNFIIEKDSSKIKKILNKNDLQIYENYINLPCEKFIITENNSSKYIFIIASVVKKKMFKVLNLFYVSNCNEMKKNWDIFKKKI